VAGFTGARFKKFSTLADAQTFMTEGIFFHFLCSIKTHEAYYIGSSVVGSKITKSQNGKNGHDSKSKLIFALNLYMS
jgi:viroplasmin and RNaseH domain-containing protein